MLLWSDVEAFFNQSPLYPPFSWLDVPWLEWDNEPPLHRPPHTPPSPSKASSSSQITHSNCWLPASCNFAWITHYGWPGFEKTAVRNTDYHAVNSDCILFWPYVTRLTDSIYFTCHFLFCHCLNFTHRAPICTYFLKWGILMLTFKCARPNRPAPPRLQLTLIDRRGGSLTESSD